MKLLVPASIALLTLTACSSSPKGGSHEVNSVYPTQFTSPAEVNPAEVNQEKYVKSWIRTVGGGYDDFKKVTIPAYTIEFITFAQAVNQNALTTMFVKADGAKNILDMKIGFPIDQHPDLMNEITEASRARMTEKFKKLGFEVVAWDQVKAQSEDAREFEQNKMNMEPMKEGNGSVSVAAKGLGRLDSIFWNAKAASTVRDTKTMVVIPHFTVGFGYFGGQETPQTIKETHGSTSIAFTPQVQIYAGSGVKISGKYEGASFELDKTAVSNAPFAKGLVKAGDTRTAAAASGENARQLAAAYHGTESKNIAVSTRAGVGYEIDLEPAKFKKAVLEQMDLVENMIVERYRAKM